MSYDPNWQPQPYRPQYAPTQPGNNNTLLIVVILAAVAFLFVRYENNGWPFDQRQQEQKQDGDQFGDRVESGGYLVFVLERTAITADQQMVLRSASEFTEGKGLDGYRSYDDDQPAASKFTQGGRDPPLVALVQNGSIVRTMPFPKNVTDLDQLFK